MNFIPKETQKKIELPFFEDVGGLSGEGWQGHTTGKSLARLRADLTVALDRLGAQMTSFMEGSYPCAEGFRPGAIIKFTTQLPNGNLIHGEIPVAALPVRTKKSAKGFEKKCEQSLRMALFMVATSLQAAFNQQVLSPGHYALMPYMLEGERTLSEIFIENAGLTGFLLESGEEGEVVDGEFIEAD